MLKRALFKSKSQARAVGASACYNIIEIDLIFFTITRRADWSRADWSRLERTGANVTF